MARDIPNVMTHAQAVEHFDEVIIPIFRGMGQIRLVNNGNSWRTDTKIGN